MQKVVGSSPIIRSSTRRQRRGFFFFLRYGGARMRAAAFVLLLATAVAISTRGATAAVPSCVKPEVRAHNEAVFGHFSTLAAANALKRRATGFGFKGIKVENEGCGDF